MPPKTAAELQAEATAAKEREAAEAQAKKAAEERSAASVWESVKGFFPDFSFFNIFFFAAVLCGGYFLGRTEEGQKFLSGIFDEKTVKGFFAKGDAMLAGVASKVGIDIDVSEALAKMPIEDIRKRLTDEKVPPKAIEILTKDKATFDSFISTIKTANGNKLGINDLSIEAIVKGPALDALLKPEKRPATIALMLAAAPADAGITAATLNTLISNNVDANGAPKPELRTLLTAATDGTLKNLQASMNGKDRKFSTVKAIEALLNSETRALIRSFGTENIAIALRDKAPGVTKETLDATLAFGDAIDKNPANSGDNRPRTLAVLRAVARMGEGVKAEEAFKGITSEQLSGFFKVPGNQAAVGNLLRVVQPSLAKHWGNADQGLAEVLASAPAAADVLSLLTTTPSTLQKSLTWLADSASISMEKRIRVAGIGGLVDQKIVDNAPDVVAFMNAGNAPARPVRTTARG